jgi:hypothetical protein
MTANPSLSIAAALRTARPDDYYKNAATIEWPNAANGEPLVIGGALTRAVVFKAARNPALAGNFVRFLTEKAGWPTIWTLPAPKFCPRCASWSSSPSGSIRATRTACARPSRC